MKYYSLFFEARGIQSYIFESGKMNEMVGASELVKDLCNSKLNDIIKHLEIEDIQVESKADAAKLSTMKPNQVFFSRRSGGVFTALFADKAVRDHFLALWSIFVTSYIPGLEAVHAVAESENIKELIEETYDILGYNRNCPPAFLPEATPMHVMAPRTGKPAVENRYEPDGKRVWTDEASIRKLDVEKFQSSHALVDSFLSPEKKNFSFPENLEFDENGNCDFPFKKGSRYLGLIHADGNGLGQSLIKIHKRIENGAEYAVLLRLFSDRLEKSTREAAQKATEKLIEKHAEDSGMLPLRPLVLGGDDLTVLVRADYAMQFTEDYCKAFEQTTEKNFADLHKVSGGIIPEKLTACAGIAYIKNNQPFMDAFNLAESLCSESKKVSKALGRDLIPATVTSLVVTNSFIESYETYKQKELSVKINDKTFFATLDAYAFDENEKEIPTLQALRNLCEELKKDGVTVSSIRQYATMIFGDENISSEKWRKWIKNLTERGLLQGLSDCMKVFGIEDVKESPWTNDGKTPLFDALQLLSMEE
jgi:hypothetical protein